MSILLVLVVIAIVMVAITGLALYVQREVQAELQRRRMQEHLARATSRLRRVEHDTIRQMHDVTEPFIDVDGSEQ